jgi:transcriptional regulator with XRE-family HTH domain
VTHLRVRELAQAKGLNILTLSQRAQLAYGTVSGLWHDKADQYNRRSLDRIAVALGVTVADLFGGEPVDTRGAEQGQYEPAWLAMA